jgi:hypothetical protein
LVSISVSYKYLHLVLFPRTDSQLRLRFDLLIDLILNCIPGISTLSTTPVKIEAITIGHDASRWFRMTSLGKFEVSESHVETWNFG